MSADEMFVICGEKMPPSIPVFKKMSLGAYICHLMQENGNQIALVSDDSTKLFSFLSR